MFVLLHHHLESWHQNPPWDNPGSELIQHSSINVFISDSIFPCLFNISIVEVEWFLSGLGLGNTCFFVLLASNLIILKKLLVQRLSGSPRNIVSFKSYAVFSFLSHFFFVSILLISLLSDRHFVLVLKESGRVWYCDVVFTFAILGNHVHLAHKLLFKLAHKSKLFHIRILF